MEAPMARTLKSGLGTAALGGGALLALAACLPIRAHEMQMSASQPSAVAAAERPFLRANDTAMTKMMNDMAIKPSGDVDKDFVDMMVPHHQGAIDMAVLELRYGHNERLKALAQEIIVTQQQEIAAMRLAVGETLPPSKSSPVDAAAAQASK
jgi:uncharacterized protein (DUF305 family)